MLQSDDRPIDLLLKLPSCVLEEHGQMILEKALENEVSPAGIIRTVPTVRNLEAYDSRLLDVLLEQIQTADFDLSFVAGLLSVIPQTSLVLIPRHLREQLTASVAMIFCDASDVAALRELLLELRHVIPECRWGISNFSQLASWHKKFASETALEESGYFLSTSSPSQPSERRVLELLYNEIYTVVRGLSEQELHERLLADLSFSNDLYEHFGGKKLDPRLAVRQLPSNVLMSFLEKNVPGVNRHTIARELVNRAEFSQWPLILRQISLDELNKRERGKLISAIEKSDLRYAESFFLELLAQTEEDSNIANAAHILSEIGRPNCIPALREKADVWFMAEEVKMEINSSIAKIRSRFRAQEGQVAVVEDKESEGQLSLNAQAQGRVALVKKQKLP